MASERQSRPDAETPRDVPCQFRARWRRYSRSTTSRTDLAVTLRTRGNSTRSRRRHHDPSPTNLPKLTVRVRFPSPVVDAIMFPVCRSVACRESGSPAAPRPPQWLSSSPHPDPDRRGLHVDILATQRGTLPVPQAAEGRDDMPRHRRVGPARPAYGLCPVLVAAVPVGQTNVCGRSEQLLSYDWAVQRRSAADVGGSRELHQQLWRPVS
jgi:hypothetical protein